MKEREIDISDFSEMLEFSPARLRRFVRLLDRLLPKKFRAPAGTLSIAIFNDRDLARIHRKFMNKPNPTDVITFEGEDDMAGEICASAERAKIVASKYDNLPSRELSLYVAHGYLHLAGVDDIAPEDAAVMRRAEALCLEILDSHFRKDIFSYV